jgi:riboflavin kinase / FMN adenylyltransferase
MQVHREIDHLPSFKRAVVTIGTFDGVHKGHQQIIHALQQEARMAEGDSIIITFDPHPRKIVQPHSSLELINSLDERVALLADKGIDHLVIVPFTPGFAAQDPEDYIQNFLIRLFNPHSIIIGYDHHFGKDRKGGFNLLAEKADKYGYKLVEIPRHVLNEIAVSSTKIRAAIRESRIGTANELLGYPFFFHGEVIHGDKIGRTLGYPTANLRYTDADKIHLGEGVYAATASVRGKIYKGMLSVGRRPTLNDATERVEINLFDFDDEIYDEEITVHVIKYLRPQVKYNNLEELKEQLSLDKTNAVNALPNH